MDYLKLNVDRLEIDQLIIHVVDPFLVNLVGPLQPTAGNIRFRYVSAVTNTTGAGGGMQNFNRYLRCEDFIIWLLSAFQKNDELEQVVYMVANLTNELIKQNIDNGFSQQIQIKDGLTTRAEVKVKNPVSLIPLRTFREVEQPLCQFVLRFQNSGQGANAEPMVALFDSDHGQWAIDAVAAIRKYIANILADAALEVALM